MNSTYWQATGTYTIRNNLNQPIANATVTIRYRTCSGVSSSTCGSWQTVTLPPTNSSGQVSGTLPYLPRSGTYAVQHVEAQVTGVTGGGVTWNGNPASLSIAKP
jgi:hypothetical protein